MNAVFWMFLAVLLVVGSLVMLHAPTVALACVGGGLTALAFARWCLS